MLVSRGDSDMKGNEKEKMDKELHGSGQTNP